jgi:hypothetical protein
MTFERDPLAFLACLLFCLLFNELGKFVFQFSGHPARRNNKVAL